MLTWGFVGLDLKFKLVVFYTGQLALTPIGASFLALVRALETCWFSFVLWSFIIRFSVLFGMEPEKWFGLDLDLLDLRLESTILMTLCLRSHICLLVLSGLSL